MTRRAAIYVRISQDKAGGGLGVQRQEDDCRAWCETNGWEVAGVYRDNDRSAYKGTRRAEYDRMLDDVKNGVVNAIVAWHPDRLHRRPVELEGFIDLIEATSCAVATVTAGDYDLTTAEGRLVARITGAVARKESEDKARRAKRKHLEKAERGKVAGGGLRPFGYAADKVTVVEAEAALIREAATRILAGDGIDTITKDWNARGLTSVTGRAWNRTTIRDFLVSGRVAGKRTHHGKVVADAVWPAVLDETTWRRVRAIILDPSRHQRPRPRRWLLSGIATCSGCGTPMASRQANNGRGRYVCARDRHPEACGRRTVVAEPLDLWIGDLIVHRLSSGAYARAARGHRANDDQARLAAAIDADEATLEQLSVDHYADRLISRAEYLAARRPIDARLETVRTQLRQIEGRAVLAPAGGDFAATWQAMNLDRRRTLVELLIDQLLIGPGRPGASRFEPARATIRWREPAT